MDDFQTLVHDTQLLEQRAHRLGMHLTGRAINEAVQKAGWEMADMLKRQRSALDKGAALKAARKGRKS